MAHLFKVDGTLLAVTFHGSRTGAGGGEDRAVAVKAPAAPPPPGLNKLRKDTSTICGFY